MGGTRATSRTSGGGSGASTIDVDSLGGLAELRRMRQAQREAEEVTESEESFSTKSTPIITLNPEAAKLDPLVFNNDPGWGDRYAPIQASDSIQMKVGKLITQKNIPMSE